MAIDIARVIRAALDAATEGSNQIEQKSSHLPLGRAMLVGASLVTAGRLVAGSRGRDLLESLQQRIADLDDGEDEQDQPEADSDEDLDEEDEEDEEDQPEAESEQAPAPRRSRSKPK